MPDLHLHRIIPLLYVLSLAACAGGGQTADPEVRDDFGVVIAPPTGAAPQRIVSLSPTTTELLFALGVGRALVGRTTWDSWPVEARAVPDLGPGIRPNVEAVLAARPDLVILYASHDNRAAAERLRAAGIPVVAFKVDRIGDFARATHLLGVAVGRQHEAATVIDTVMRTLERVRASTAARPHPTVYWHIWDNPLITIGAGSFMHELVEIAGGRNIYGDDPAPSPQVSMEDVARRDPDIVLAGPVGRQRIRTEPRWQAVAAVRRGDVRIVDTNLVARPSVRIGEAAVSLARVLHGEATP